MEAEEGPTKHPAGSGRWTGHQAGLQEVVVRSEGVSGEEGDGSEAVWEVSLWLTLLSSYPPASPFSQLASHSRTLVCLVTLGLAGQLRSEKPQP